MSTSAGPARPELQAETEAEGEQSSEQALRDILDSIRQTIVLLSPNGAFRMLCPSQGTTTGSHLSSVLRRDNARGSSFR